MYSYCFGGGIIMDVTSAQVNGFCIFGPSFLCFDLEPGAFTGVGSPVTFSAI